MINCEMGGQGVNGVNVRLTLAGVGGLTLWQVSCGGAVVVLTLSRC